MACGLVHMVRTCSGCWRSPTAARDGSEPCTSTWIVELVTPASRSSAPALKKKKEAEFFLKKDMAIFFHQPLSLEINE